MPATDLDPRLVSLTEPASLEAEQYQALRLKLERLQQTRTVQLIAVSSPGTSDGKTVTAINLAAALSHGAGARVLLIEADLRRPALGRYLGLEKHKRPGLADVVLDSARSLNDVIWQHPQLRFDVALAGTGAGPIHEVFRSDRFQSVLQQARQQYDYAVLDTPPLAPVADCALLAQWLDGVLLVVAAHKTTRRLLEQALNRLEPAHVLGIILNRDDQPFAGYRGRDYRGRLRVAQ